jgi:hypothetical protein
MTNIPTRDDFDKIYPVPIEERTYHGLPIDPSYNPPRSVDFANGSTPRIVEGCSKISYAVRFNTLFFYTVIRYGDGRVKEINTGYRNGSLAKFIVDYN